MKNALQAKIRRQVADHDVKHIQLWFTDHIGELEMVEIPGHRLDELLENGALANDSSTSGFGASAGADIVAVPDWSSFKILAASYRDDTTAAVFCSLTSMGFFGADLPVLC
jgi:glutamine synthetase